MNIRGINNKKNGLEKKNIEFSLCEIPFCMLIVLSHSTHPHASPFISQPLDRTLMSQEAMLLKSDASQGGIPWAST